VNQNWTLNAAGQRYLALMDEWKTDVTGTTGATGKFAFRGFQGSYKLTVTVPGASPVVQTLELAPGASVQQVTVTVDDGGPVGPEAPAAPGGLVAAAGNAQVALSWNASIGATGYNVKRSTASGGPYVTVAAGTVGTSYTDTGVTNGTTYYYAVSAINAAGESANSAAASATPNVPVASDLVVQYKVNNPNPGDNQITAQFNIKNRGSAPVAMTGLKLRYYFTKEGVNAALNFWSDYAQIGGSNVSGTFVTMAAPKPGADTYLEISFGAGAGSIPANGQSGEIHARFAKSDWSNFNESDDYSYDGTKSSFVDWSKVTLYLNGQRLWGNEP
jgi:cellulose 1,4-beta-cellobiosidase